MANSARKKILIVLLSVVLFFIAAIAGVSLWVAHSYKYILLKRMPDVVSRATNGLYTVKVQDLDINIVTRTVVLKKIAFHPNAATAAKLKDAGERPKALFHFDVPEISVSGIGLTELVFDHTFACSRLIIGSPRLAAVATVDTAGLEVEHKVDAADEGKGEAPGINRFKADQIEIIDPEVTLYSIDGSDSLYGHTNGGTIVLHDWEYGGDAKKDTAAFFYAKRAEVMLEQMELVNTSGMYDLKLAQLDFRTERNSIKINDFSMSPNVTHEEFYQRKGHQAEIYTVQLPQVTLSGFDWARLINDKEFEATAIAIDSAAINIFFDRQYPVAPRTKVGRFPHQLLLAWDVPVTVPELRLNECTIEYKEVNKQRPEGATVSFTNINGTVNNVTNIDGLIAANPTCKAQLTANFMDRAPVAATLNLQLASKIGEFEVDAQMHGLKAAQIADVTRALGGVDMEEVDMQELQANVTGNDNGSKAKVHMLYKGLKVGVLKSTDGKKSETNTTVSFLANELLLLPDNPTAGEPERTATVAVKRDTTKGFFNIIWKTVYAGARDIALKENAIKDVIVDDAGKPKKKGGFLRRLFKKK